MSHSPRDRPVVGGAGQRPSIRADRHVLQPGSVFKRAADPAIAGQRTQHGQDGAARLNGRLATVGLESEQAGQGDVVLEAGEGSRGEVARGRGALLISRALDAVGGEDGRDPGDHHEHGDPVRDGAPAPGSRGAELALLAARPASRNARSMRLRSGSWRGATPARPPAARRGRDRRGRALTGPTRARRR